MSADVQEAPAWEGKLEPVAAAPPRPLTLAGRAIRGGAVLLATRLAVQAGTWAVTLIVARLLTPFDYGLMTTGMIFIGLADILAEAGVGRALVQKEDLKEADLAGAFTFSFLLSAVLYAGLCLVAAPAAVLLEMPALGPFLRLLSLLVLLVPFRTVAQAVLDRDLRLSRQAALHVLTSSVQSATVLGLAALGAGYWSLAAGALLARFLEAATLQHAAGWRPRLGWPGRGVVTFGMHLSLGSLLWYAYSNADFAVVGKLSGPVALGYYALAFQLISLPVQKLSANVNQVIYPVFCRLQGDKARLRDLYLRETVLLGMLAMPALAGLALVAPDAFPLILGRRWDEAVVPFQLLSAVGVLMTYSASLAPLFNALGRPDVNLRYTACCALLFPAAFLAGGLAAGLVGICLAWLVLYPLLVGGLLRWTRPLTGVGPLDLLRAQAPVVAGVLVMAAVVLGVRAGLAEMDARLRLVVSIAVGACTYAAVLLAFARGTALADVRFLLSELRRGGQHLEGSGGESA